VVLLESGARHVPFARYLEALGVLPVAPV